MTRDAQRAAGDFDGRADISSAFWAAAPLFPQLPPDAPPVLKKLTVDVDDPGQVYSVYRASRRHGFQLLVERYIFQLRYGCQDPRCNSPTCFTCRRRIAGTTPVRRYNATSARTLACYLASQDNPEKGLCPYGGVSQHLSTSHGHVRGSLKGTALAEIPKNSQRSGKGLKTSLRPGGNSTGSGSAPPNHDDKSNVKKSFEPKTNKEDQEEIEISSKKENALPVAQNLLEPMKTDHRSFIQNLFGTTAFRMLEWLTPKALESRVSTAIDVSGLVTGEAKVGNDHTHPPGPELPFPSAYFLASKETKRNENPKITSPRQMKAHQSSKPNNVLNSELSHDSAVQNSGDDTLSAPMRHLAANDSDKTDNEQQKSRDVRNPAPQTLPSIRHVNRPEIRDVKDWNPIEIGPSKSGHFSGHATKSAHSDVPKCSAEGQPILLAKKPRKPLASVTSSKDLAGQGQEGGVSSRTDRQSPAASITREASITTVIYTEKSKVSGLGINPTRDVPEQPSPMPNTTFPSPVDSRPLPQTLSMLSTEAVRAMYEIWFRFRRSDSNLGFSYPLVQNCRGAYLIDLSTNSPEQMYSPEQVQLESRWKVFLEQSIFYVLSSPTRLLKSFAVKDQLMESQTLWYYLGLMVWNRSTVVFDSLWISAAELYVPPRELWPIYDWAKRPGASNAHKGAGCTTEEAARIMTICLHALITAIPIIRDPTQIHPISRARSYGHSAVHGHGASGVVIEECLAINDVFSDELALRLARRIFAAIPARRQFQDLLKLDQVAHKASIKSLSAPDILDLVLASFNFLDADVRCIEGLKPQEPEDRHDYEKLASTQLVDWARAVMLQDWSGRAEVSADGPFGGALAMMSAIYDKRQSLLLSDVQLRTSYFSDRLDSMEMPIEWLAFTPNKKTIHLLDHPFLFSPAALVTYFRAINFSRMSRSFEASNTMMGRIHLTMQPTTLMTDVNRREDLLDRLRTATARFLVLQIRRDFVLADAFDQLWRREKRELLRPLKIRLGEDSGEEGSDSGGVQQEFFRLAIAEALNPDNGTFSIDERTRMTWFQPGSPQPLWKFELIGLIISLAVYNGLTLPITFPKALYRKLLARPVTELHHIEDGWPELASGLTTLLEWDERDGTVSDVFSRTYEFSAESFGQQISRDMAAGIHWPQFGEASGSNPEDVRLVDDQNRNEYVSDYILWLTDVSIGPQFKAFQRGFLACLEGRSLSLFDPETLQSVVEGVQEIDISELRRVARYVGWDADHKTVKDFWSIVKKFNVDEKKKLLEFVTASDRIPVGGMSNVQFVIQRHGFDDVDGRLPTSYTCYGTLLLPEYSSKEILKEKMAMALENSKGFGFA